jgi:hypothetical protein
MNKSVIDVYEIVKRNGEEEQRIDNDLTTSLTFSG